MPPNEVSRNRRKRERQQRRNDILSAAHSILLSQGIHNTTVDDVATAAELSKGTIYLYFQSKETLLAALLQQGLDLLVRQLEIAFAVEEDLDAPTRLRRLARAYFDFFQDHPLYYRLMMTLDRWRVQEAVEQDVYEQTLMRSTRGLTFVIKTIEQGVQDGEFFTESPKEAASVLWAMLHGLYVVVGHPLRREMVEADLEQLYHSALELAIRGLKC